MDSQTAADTACGGVPCTLYPGTYISLHLSSYGCVSHSVDDAWNETFWFVQFAGSPHYGEV